MVAAGREERQSQAVFSLCRRRGGRSRTRSAATSSATVWLHSAASGWEQRGIAS